MTRTPHKPTDIGRNGLTKLAKLKRDEAPATPNCQAWVMSRGMAFYRERRCWNKVKPPHIFCHVHRSDS